MQKVSKDFLLFIGFSTLFLTGCSNTLSQETSLETKETSSSSNSFQIQTKMTETSFSESTTVVSSSEEVIIQPTLEDFIGGWGIPNSGEFFFINSDYTTTLHDGSISTIDASFSTTEDGRLVMTNIVNGEEFSSILEHDGTLTASNGTSYEYMGNYDYEEFKKIKAEELNQSLTSTTNDPIITTANSAIEAAKLFMSDGQDVSMLDGYSFDDFGLTSTSYRPYYTVNVRQKASNGFKSMAIGRIIVYTDNGECIWE